MGGLESLASDFPAFAASPVGLFAVETLAGKCCLHLDFWREVVFDEVRCVLRRLKMTEVFSANEREVSREGNLMVGESAVPQQNPPANSNVRYVFHMGTWQHCLRATFTSHDRRGRQRSASSTTKQNRRRKMRIATPPPPPSPSPNHPLFADHQHFFDAAPRDCRGAKKVRGWSDASSSSDNTPTTPVLPSELCARKIFPVFVFAMKVPVHLATCERRRKCTLKAGITPPRRGQHDTTKTATTTVFDVPDRIYSPTVYSRDTTTTARTLASQLGVPGSIPGGVIPGFSHGESCRTRTLHSGVATYSPHFVIIGFQELLKLPPCTPFIDIDATYHREITKSLVVKYSPIVLHNEQLATTYSGFAHIGQTSHLPPRRTGFDSKTGVTPGFSHVVSAFHNTALRCVAMGCDAFDADDRRTESICGFTIMRQIVGDGCYAANRSHERNFKFLARMFNKRHTKNWSVGTKQQFFFFSFFFSFVAVRRHRTASTGCFILIGYSSSQRIASQCCENRFNRAGRRRWPAYFLWDLPFPSPLHFDADPRSSHITLIGSQHPDVSSRPNLSTPYVGLLTSGPLRSSAQFNHVLVIYNLRISLFSVRLPGGGNGRCPRKPADQRYRPVPIPTCENPVTRPGIEPGSPWWEASVLIAQPPWPQHKGPPTCLMFSSAFEAEKRGRFKADIATCYKCAIAAKRKALN
ncbi:hypothetical protein PR048_027885 [Dryococelus australis]|uniref:Uncharacterized protein n=1 Tax=Dryococelus australis TaxID=614101 RepID=A0ABQ9GHP5_9NEOP|nr:hypothetical protein PR048_027885 [Dryococelus australis]